MDENRKKVIVNELLYWKKSRMLPDRYCDYLLALYTEGSQPKEIKKHKSVMGRIWPILFSCCLFQFLLY
ncbi:hypothetical protein NX029_06770 [Cytobacillus firmus]|nr:hypothetical protein [Cytobacillus firmus]